MIDLANFHVKTVRAGEADFTDHEKHSFVRYDNKTLYYDFTDLDVTADEWESFVMRAWELFPEDEFECGVYDAEHSTFYARIYAYNR